MISWGIIATAVAFVPNPTVLVILRFLLGVAEAGFFPASSCISHTGSRPRTGPGWLAWFMVAIPISTAVGSTLSSLLIQGVTASSG